jgi:hypothetical protein
MNVPLEYTMSSLKSVVVPQFRPVGAPSRPLLAIE